VLSAASLLLLLLRRRVAPLCVLVGVGRWGEEAGGALELELLLQRAASATTCISATHSQQSEQSDFGSTLALQWV
jgi:hypothetical protein